jgi:hypothetical protein
MESAARRCAVDPADELTVLGLDTLLLARGDGRFEPSRERLDRGAVAEVLEPLAGGGADALLLLLDVRHREKSPRSGRAGS